MKPIPLEVTMMKRIGELKADLLNCFTAIRVKEEENARLKAEVERLTAFTTRTIIPNELLQAEVERLTKAGDAMADRLMYQGYPATVPAWHTAKEGKQP